MDHQDSLSPSGRPRAGSRSYSTRSGKSDKSGTKSHAPSAHDLAEKQRRDSFLRGESKANPNAAVLEAQPATRNVFEKVTLESVRSVASKDAQGNLISEPDLSNPTRSRWERPLDTIRSFERAVDGDYHRRTVSRAVSENEHTYSNNRSSYYAGNQSRANGHYGGRTENNYYDGQAPPPSRARYGRVQSDGARYYGNHSQAYNTYGGGSHEGSDSTGPWGNGTNPSSQNSSYERLHGIGKRGQSPEQAYGMDSYATAPINEESDDYGFPARPVRKNVPSYGMASTPQPDYQPAPPRQVISLGNSAGDMYRTQGGQLPSAVRVDPGKEEKSKGWLSRRFSKNK